VATPQLKPSASFKMWLSKQQENNQIKSARHKRTSTHQTHNVSLMRPNIHPSAIILVAPRCLFSVPHAQFPPLVPTTTRGASSSRADRRGSEVGPCGTPLVPIRLKGWRSCRDNWLGRRGGRKCLSFSIIGRFFPRFQLKMHRSGSLSSPALCFLTK
jgi:hypothetical protein